jgi:ParB family chromosome partitioning protein
MRVDKAKTRPHVEQDKTDSTKVKNPRNSVYTEEFRGEYYNISIDKLIPFKNQARKYFDEESIEGLASTIKEHGIRQPLTIIPSDIKEGFYEVISGERRLRAAKVLGLKTVPCIIVHDKMRAEEIAIIENIQRKDLHPVELGYAYQNLLDMQICNSTAQVAQKLGTHKSSVIEALSFTSLDDVTKELLLKHQLKNRALLRTLVKTPLEQRKTYIERYLASVDNLKLQLKSKKRSLKTKSQILNIVYDGGDFVINKNRLQDLDAALKEKLKALVMEALG